MEDDFVVPINGLSQGRTEFRRRVGKKFFERFENSEILAADLDVEVLAEKSGRFIGIDCDVDGSVTVVCDRCLEDLRLPVRTGFRLSVKFGKEPSGGDAEEGEREIVWLPESDADLDLGQIVYDYVCLSLPVQRTHQEGGCNPDAVRFLSSEDDLGNESEGDEDASLPFASLKDLMDKVK